MRAILKRIPGLREAVVLLRGKPALDPREYLLSRLPRGSVCAEIGVHEGQFSSQIMRQVKPKRLHLIDPWKHEEETTYQHSWYGGLGEEGQLVMDRRYEGVKDQFDGEIKSGRVVVHREASSDVVGDFDDDYFDWIYVDGNHQYDFVKRDLELYDPKVKADGFITGDDYGVEGWWANGVQRAVDEFVEKRDGLTLEVRGRQFMIKKAKQRRFSRHAGQTARAGR